MAKKRKTVEDLTESGKGFFADFKKFIMKGNVLDLAIAVVIGNAFNAITNGLVKNIITPLMTYFTSGVSINEWEVVLRDAVLDDTGAVVTEKVSIQYGLWLQSIVDFLIIAFAIFVVLRILHNAENKLNAKKIAAEEAAAVQKKAEEEAAAAKAAKEAEEKAAAEEAQQREYYETVKEQSRLLREISEKLTK